MQIKRFEAEDMTDALRMVKREFGDDAVILSAKEIRPGGFFSAFRKKSVEITAAADYPMDTGGTEVGDFSKALCDQLDSESENDRVSLSGKTQPCIPFTAPAESDDGPPPPAEPVRPVGRFIERLVSGPQSNATGKLPSNTRGDGGSAKGASLPPKTAEPFYRDLSQRKIIALVGAHGTGKSTAIAKLARHCREVEKKTVALISLDRFHIGANSTLSKVSQMLDLPFVVARDSKQLRSVLDAQAHVDLVLVDTPGMGRTDTVMLNHVVQLLTLIEPDEIHLAVNVTARQAVINTWVHTFQSAGIDHLFLTHMDELGADDPVMDQIQSHRLPSSFYSDGVDLFDHLQETTIDERERSCTATPQAQERIADFPSPKVPTPVAVDPDDDDSIHFVANRNSELFHHPDCRSVKRINVENITAFNSIEQALEEGFKPCRACCNIQMIRKSVPSAIGPRRVSAM